MARDYKPFQRAVWDIRDWHTLEEMIEHFWYFSTSALNPGQELLIDTVIIPSGNKYHFSEAFYSTQFDGEVWLYFPQIGAKTRGFVKANEVNAISFDIPYIFPAGTIAKIYVRNDDIVPGHWDVEGSVYKFPASEPEKPKNDDPEEIFRVRDFNYLVATFLPNGEQIKIFRKVKEDRVHFLRISNFGTKNQRVVGKAHINLEHLDDLISTLHNEPEKVKGILDKFEKEYRLKK